jgi:ATP-dependent Clp protease ATP-binding subunit ClpC
MTSNVGVRDIKAGGSIGFSDKSPDGQYDQMKSTIEESMRRMFNPEFLNRIDDYIVFKQLKKEHIHAIIDIQLEKLLKRMQSMNIELVLSPEAKDFLVDKGYDEKYGARPLRRALQKYLEDPLAEELLKSVVKEDTLVDVDFSTQLQELTFSVLPKPKLALPAHETTEGDPSPEEDPMSAE